VFSLAGAAFTGDEAATGVDAAAGVVAGGGCLGVLGRFLAGASSSSDSREERFVADLFSAGCSFLISTTFGLLKQISSLPLSKLLSELGMSSTSVGCKFNKNCNKI
jgi:hypothetical protein